MNAKHKHLWILTAFFIVPLVAAGVTAMPYLGGGYAGRAGEGGRRGPMSPDDQLKRMTKDFNLTADQQAKIKPILVDEQTKMVELRNDSSADRRAMRGEMMQIRRDANEQVRAQLDDKQKEKFDKQEQDRQDRMQKRRGGSGGPGDDNSTGNPPPQN
jgi:periplasmic protein CpxP/Spy